MLKVVEIRFPVYAENENEAETLSEALFSFVDEQRCNGIPVTANALISALNTFKSNVFVKTYLRNHK
jgi:hypothetical protein